MTDDELLRAFEAGELPAGSFPHEAHVRVVWCYLSRAPLLTALTRFRTALQRFAATNGRPKRYHETITVACVLLIAERQAAMRGSSWSEFAARHPDLLRWNPSLLARFYSDEILWSERARTTFVPPDRTG